MPITYTFWQIWPDSFQFVRYFIDCLPSTSLFIHLTSFYSPVRYLAYSTVNDVISAMSLNAAQHSTHLTSEFLHPNKSVERISLLRSLSCNILSSMLGILSIIAGNLSLTISRSYELWNVHRRFSPSTENNGSVLTDSLNKPICRCDSEPTMEKKAFLDNAEYITPCLKRPFASVFGTSFSPLLHFFSTLPIKCSYLFADSIGTLT